MYWFGEISGNDVKMGSTKQALRARLKKVFTTQQARPVMQLTSAAVLLSPTPSFWGHPQGRTGTNHPHAIIYIGDRSKEFQRAFQPFGIPLASVWNQVVAEFIPEQ